MPELNLPKAQTLRIARLALPLAACLSTLFAPAAAFAAPAVIKQVEEHAPAAFPAGQNGRPSGLTRMNLRIDNTVIGELQGGWLCGRKGDVALNKTTYPQLMPSVLMARRFRAELVAAQFPVRQASDAIFEEKKDTDTGKTDLQVGMLIKDVAGNLCQKGTREWTGEAYIKVFWQVFAPEQKKVLFETTTEGRFATAGNAVANPAEIFVNATGMAMRSLLAEPGYLKAVTDPVDSIAATALAASGAASGAAPLVQEKLTVEGGRASDEPLVQKLTLLRTAVVTVIADSGSGTGFYVGKNDLLLTDRHVVGDAKFVKVKLPTGREMIGEVLRTDAKRDVALIRTEPAGVPPLPVRFGDPKIGDDVFVLGSPLGDKFNTTLTKGILGGFREINQQNYLQSDVTVMPGNSGGPLLDSTGRVIGIAVMAVSVKGISGMNFFIPVGDAFDKLGLKMAER